MSADSAFEMSRSSCGETHLLLGLLTCDSEHRMTPRVHGDQPGGVAFNEGLQGREIDGPLNGYANVRRAIFQTDGQLLISGDAPALKYRHAESPPPEF